MRSLSYGAGSPSPTSQWVAHEDQKLPEFPFGSLFVSSSGLGFETLGFED